MLYPHTPSTTHTEWPFTMLQNRTLWVCRHKHGVSSSANVRSPCVYTRNLRSSAEDLSERCISKQSKVSVGTPMLNISKYYFRIALFDANFRIWAPRTDVSAPINISKSLTNRIRLRRMPLQPATQLTAPAAYWVELFRKPNSSQLRGFRLPPINSCKCCKPPVWMSQCRMRAPCQISHAC